MKIPLQGDSDRYIFICYIYFDTYRNGTCKENEPIFTGCIGKIEGSFDLIFSVLLSLV